MKTTWLALVTASLLGASTLFAQGSGTTSTSKTTTTKKSSYQTIHHVNGVVTERSDTSITVKSGAKSRHFTVTNGTRFVRTKAAKGAKVKISYRSSAPRVAVEVRRRG